MGRSVKEEWGQLTSSCTPHPNPRNEGLHWSGPRWLPTWQVHSEPAYSREQGRALAQGHPVPGEGTQARAAGAWGGEGTGPWAAGCPSVPREGFFLLEMRGGGCGQYSHLPGDQGRCPGPWCLRATLSVDRSPQEEPRK